ncbi:MAG: thioredoxin family protein [Anaerolineaceae bacterium]|nr:thioredoxin family protein [Anaerolineaceae bacterium]
MGKMLDKEIQKQLVDVFKNLEQPVKMFFFGSKISACEYCDQTHELIEEVAELSDKIELQAYDIDKDPDIAEKFRVEKVPGIVVAAKNGEEVVDYGIRFAGIPAGHEFSSLIQSLLLVSKRDSGLSDAGREFLSNLETPINLQVFVTTSCGYCPQAVTLAHQIAMESEFVDAEMVEASEFYELSTTYGVSGVPHTLINAGAGEMIGAGPELMLLEKIKEVLSVAN